MKNIKRKKNYFIYSLILRDRAEASSSGSDIDSFDEESDG